ncbi:MAG: hypothetical protein KBT04_06350, partial [Bacteroidales bacterium]|nr:hypothetical protein [Candidatus Colimorpha onthohippi]
MVAVLSVGVRAQYASMPSNYYSFYMGGGLHSASLNTSMGTTKVGAGFLFQGEYQHFIDEHYGYAVSLKYSSYQSSFNISDVESVGGVIHPDNKLEYESKTYYNDWNEVQTFSVIAIPIQGYYRMRLNKKSLLFVGLGAQLDFLLVAKYATTKGSFDTRGFFGYTGQEYQDLPNHGFDTYKYGSENDIDAAM